MELNKIFKDGLWSTEINVRDFVSHNITPYYGDASFLEGPTERTKAVWNRCLEALAEERANNGVRSLDNVTVSTITSHKAGYIDKENELIVGLQTDELLKRAIKPFGGINVVSKACHENGVEVDDRGFIRVDKQLRTNVPHIFAIGDIVGQPMLAHKGVHEGHVAAEVIAGKKHYFDPKVIPSIAYTEPEVAWVGLTEKEAKEKGISYETATFPWAASGRAIASDCADGMTKLIFDKESHRVIGGAIVGTNGGELLGEIGLAIEMGCDAEDIALTIHAHPTLHESVGLAAEVFEGSITDLPNPKAKKK